VFLVPKGTRVKVLHDVRPYPRARRITIRAGVYRVLYVMVDKRPSDTGGDSIYTYVVDAETNTRFASPVELLIDPDADKPKAYTADGDALYDEGMADDNKPWGWYGLDWTFDAEQIDSPLEGYSRLRRMKKIGSV
jgi:hypothetical protein